MKCWVFDLASQTMMALSSARRTESPFIHTTAQPCTGLSTAHDSVPPTADRRRTRPKSRLMESSGLLCMVRILLSTFPQDHPGRIVSRRPDDAAARVGRRAAKVEAAK